MKHAVYVCMKSVMNKLIFSVEFTLFAVPVFAGLSALGSIVGSTAGVVKAINDYKNGQKLMEENKRHNHKMEAITIGKGYYLQPYKRGKGYFLKPYPKN